MIWLQFSPPQWGDSENSREHVSDDSVTFRLRQQPSEIIVLEAVSRGDNSTLLLKSRELLALRLRYSTGCGLAVALKTRAGLVGGDSSDGWLHRAEP
jgi:hypothetical protein